VTYTALAGLAVIAAVIVDGLVLRTNLVRRKAFWTSYAIIVTFQLVVNGVLTGLPVVRYNPSVILGWRIGYAPVEDLLFGFAMVLLTLSMWVWLGRRAFAARATDAPSESTRR
jgi:lycopene cyclase domain-containing protein